MKNRSPVYHLLHQEMRTCAGCLLEIGQSTEFSMEKDSQHILNRLLELHALALKVRASEHYAALYAFKHYVENSMLLYKDEQDTPQTIRLSEAISLLSTPSQTEQEFLPRIIESLRGHFVRHFLEEAKPGRPLFKNLTAIKGL